MTKILIDRAVVEQALEALKAAHYNLIDAGVLDQSLLNKNFTAHDALRTALAEPAEPVATWETKYDMQEWQVHALRAGWSPTPADHIPDATKLVPEALRQALEVLHAIIPDVHDWYGKHTYKAHKTIAALRERRGEPK